MSEIIGLSFFAMVANAEDCVDIQRFGEAHEEFLREYFVLEHGIPSHDTITKNDKTITETRYFISSLGINVKEIARAIRGQL